jgi:hypothetical protein
VIAATRDQQVLWDHSSLVGEVIFGALSLDRLP